VGVWSRFDKFNPINVEVLSVMVEQLDCTRLAPCLDLKRFDLEKTEIVLGLWAGRVVHLRILVVKDEIVVIAGHLVSVACRRGYRITGVFD
jgi:hypothetical protein